MGILEEINENLKSLKSDFMKLSQKVSNMEASNIKNTEKDAIVLRFEKNDKLNLAFASEFLNIPQSKIKEYVKKNNLKTATKSHYSFYANELIDFKNSLKNGQNVKAITKKKNICHSEPVVTSNELRELMAINN